MKSRNHIEIVGHNHLMTLRNCGGYYSCPKDADGKRLGPLVGYAGKYMDVNGPLQWVGDIYANFAKAEIHPTVLEHFARHLGSKFNATIELDNVDYFCAAPIGGYSLGVALSLRTNIPMIKAEKKVLAVATPTSREKSTLVFGRHNIEPGSTYVIVEDVCNNFSTTEELIGLIIAAGGIVLGIVCFLNRSLVVEDSYTSAIANANIPVVSLVRLPIKEYRHDNPEVQDDVKKGNVIWKAKDEWDRLMLAMNQV